MCLGAPFVAGIWGQTRILNYTIDESQVWRIWGGNLKTPMGFKPGIWRSQIPILNSYKTHVISQFHSKQLLLTFFSSPRSDLVRPLKVKVKLKLKSTRSNHQELKSPPTNPWLHHIRKRPYNQSGQLRTVPAGIFCTGTRKGPETSLLKYWFVPVNFGHSGWYFMLQSVNEYRSGTLKNHFFVIFWFSTTPSLSSPIIVATPCLTQPFSL